MLDKITDAQRIGLLQAGLGMLASPSYGNFGAQVGRGGLLGIQGYDRATRTGILAAGQQSRDQYRKDQTKMKENALLAAALERQRIQDDRAGNPTASSIPPTESLAPNAGFDPSTPNQQAAIDDASYAKLPQSFRDEMASAQALIAESQAQGPKFNNMLAQWDKKEGRDPDTLTTSQAHNLLVNDQNPYQNNGGQPIAQPIAQPNIQPLPPQKSIVTDILQNPEPRAQQAETAQLSEISRLTAERNKLDDDIDAFIKDPERHGDYTESLRKKRDYIQSRIDALAPDEDTLTYKDVKTPEGPRIFAYRKDGSSFNTGNEPADKTSLINQQFGGPTPAIDDRTGKPVLLQPSRSGGDPSVMKHYRPMTSQERKGLPAADQSVLAAIDTIGQLKLSLVQNTGYATGVVGLPGAASKAGETFKGFFDPFAPTPARTFSARIEGLKGRIHKDLVGSGQVSNAEWRQIDKALGVGIFTTAGAAMQALEDVEKIMMSKGKKFGPPVGMAPIDAMYAVDPNGKNPRMVSFDGGKTWQKAK